MILAESPTQRSDITTLTAEAKYYFHFTEQGNKFCLSLYYNESSSYLFANEVKAYQFKAKDSKSNAHRVCLRNISKYFPNFNMTKY